MTPNEVKAKWPDAFDFASNKFQAKISAPEIIMQLIQNYKASYEDANRILTAICWNTSLEEHQKDVFACLKDASKDDKKATTTDDSITINL